MLSINANAVYVAHYSPLVDRRKSLERQLDEIKVKATWFENEPASHEAEMLYETSIDEWRRKSALGYKHTEPYRKLNKADISLLYKHIKIWEAIVEENIEICLVLEDDIIFEEDFVNKFNLNLHQTPRDWDFIFIGSGCNLRIAPERIQKGVPVYKKSHPASKCSDSYVVTKDAAQKVLNTFRPFTLPIDFELNYHMFEHNMNVYWWEPPITKQGSECGIFSVSNIDRTKGGL